jgi:hypothetical protein
MAQSGEISPAEARKVAGKALFGDDWIELSKKELQLLAGPNGPRRKMLPNGRPITIIAPCPRARRKHLDLAIGRRERAFIQYSTTIDVLHDSGFADIAKSYDRRLLTNFLESIRRSPQQNSRSRPAGKPPDKIEGVKQQMNLDIREGVEIALLKQKELAANYNVSRGTAVKARAEVLKALDRK